MLAIVTAGWTLYSHWSDPSPSSNVTVDINELVEQLVKAQKPELSASEQRNTELQEQIRALTEAVTALTQQKDQPDPPPGVAEALRELAEGKTAAAKAIFQEVRSRKVAEGKTAHKEAAAASRHLGALAYLHDTQEALSAYRQAVDLDPDNAADWNRLGHLLLRVGGLNGAETAYRKILTLGNSISDQSLIAGAYGNLGNVYKTPRGSGAGRGDVPQGPGA